jgi:hypothetical protein
MTMKIPFRFRFVVPAAWMPLFLAVATSSASACPACYGDTTGSKMGNAAQVGIFAMVAIMFVMLSAVGAFIWHLAYRVKHPLPDYEELLREDATAPAPGYLPVPPQPEST